jgi:membrane-associated phospholipid phosphatase
MTSIDTYVLQSLFALREPHAVIAFIWVSQFGEWYVTGGLAVALALWLALRERFSLAQGVILSVATSAVGAVVIKTLVARARPPMSFWAYTESGFSFPSAHAAMSLAFYGFLIFMVAISTMRPLWRRSINILLILLILAIGFSRLYLGVHYFSDVIGGYVVGALCLWLSVWATRSLQMRSARLSSKAVS